MRKKPDLKVVENNEVAAGKEVIAEETIKDVDSANASTASNDEELSNAVSEGEALVGEGAVAPVVNEASVTFRKSHSKRLINAMASGNDARIEETDDSYTIISPFIKVSRADVEAIVGKISDAKWRMLFINRSGIVQTFNSYEFAIGIPMQVAKEDEPSKESVQLNIRIDKTIKDEIEKYRAPDIMDLTQNAFVEEALREFIANIKRELIAKEV